MHADEKALREVIARDVLYWFKRGGGKLMTDAECATIKGKHLMVLRNCVRVLEIRARERAINRKE